MKAKGYTYEVLLLKITNIMNPRAFRVVLVLWRILDPLISEAQGLV